MVHLDEEEDFLETEAQDPLSQNEQVEEIYEHQDSCAITSLSIILDQSEKQWLIKANCYYPI